jgi:hypothetical protein
MGCNNIETRKEDNKRQYEIDRASPAKPGLSQNSSIVLVAATASTESRSNISNSDVAESNTRSRIIGLNKSRVSFSSVARTSTSAVQPVHELTGVIPDGHGENHTAFECLAHLCESATLLEGRGHNFAERFFDGVDAHTGDLDDSVLDNLVVLDVETSDVAEGAGGSTVVCVELGDYGERLKRGLVDGLLMDG